jgi:hypothetical protein
VRASPRLGKTTLPLKASVTGAPAAASCNVKKKIRAKLLALGGTIVPPGYPPLDAGLKHRREGQEERQLNRPARR